MYHHLSDYYNDLFPQDPALKGFIKGFSMPGFQAIDLGSGTGRLTKLISDLGMNVIGIDLDESMIEVARKNYPELDFIAYDMVEYINNSKKFELMTCFGNTLVHLDISQMEKFFKEVQKKLSPKGYFIVQILNYMKILKEKPKELKELKNNYITLNRYYEYFDDYILFTTKLISQDKEFLGTTKLYPYTMDVFSSLLKSIGLKFQFFGDLKLKPFEESDYYLYMVITLS
jgi:glycine/sarcosine N-methyltransferase